MQVERIAANERGLTQTDWLTSWHTFSFGKYFNHERLNFGTLRVFNEDHVKPGRGFETHRHENMEIVTLVLSGALEHQDSRGNQEILRAGSVQRMSAGRGIEHSEKNPSQTDPVHFLQIWIYPHERDLTPSYEQKIFDTKSTINSFTPIVSSAPSETALPIHQDAQIYLGEFEEGETVAYSPSGTKRGVFLFVIEGELRLGDWEVKEGDTLKISDPSLLELKMGPPSKVLLVEVSLLAF